MNPEQLTHFKERLLEEKQKLEQELEDFAKKNTRDGKYEATYPESGGSSDDDNALEIAEYADDVSIEARIESELRDVESALKSIDKGTYGTCKYCNQIIDEKRLEARPASSSCISCKKVLTQEM